MILFPIMFVSVVAFIIALSSFSDAFAPSLVGRRSFVVFARVKAEKSHPPDLTATPVLLDDVLVGKKTRTTVKNKTKIAYASPAEVTIEQAVDSVVEDAPSVVEVEGTISPIVIEEEEAAIETDSGEVEMESSVVEPTVLEPKDLSPEEVAAVRRQEMLDAARLALLDDSYAEQLAEVLTQGYVGPPSLNYTRGATSGPKVPVKSAAELATERRRAALVKARAMNQLVVEVEVSPKKKRKAEVQADAPTAVEAVQVESVDVGPFYGKILKSIGSMSPEPGSKPSTTYITFCALARPLLKAENPDMLSPKLISELGRLWREAPPIVRTVFEQKYAAEKKAYDTAR